GERRGGVRTRHDRRVAAGPLGRGRGTGTHASHRCARASADVRRRPARDVPHDRGRVRGAVAWRRGGALRLARVVGGGGRVSGGGGDGAGVAGVAAAATGSGAEGAGGRG